MTHPQQTDPAAKGRSLLDEADIGSGEKTPGQRETDEMIRQIPPLPPAGQQPQQQQPQQAQQQTQQQPGADQAQDKAQDKQAPAGRA